MLWLERADHWEQLAKKAAKAQARKATLNKTPHSCQAQILNSLQNWTLTQR
jgi:hypothetical protein